MIDFLLGDSRFFWQENIKFFSQFPSAWDSSLNTGVGIPQVNTLWITSYLNLTASFSIFGFSWPMISLVFWIIPIVAISFISSFLLYRSIIDKNNLFASLAGIIYTTNTYFLLIFLGGQMGVAFAYSFIPFVFLAFIKLLKNPSFYSSILTGFVLSIQVLFDPRLSGLTAISLLLLYAIRFKFSKKDLLYCVSIPFVIVLLLHAFWILPLFFYKSNIIPHEFKLLEGIKFLSFARLENTISLLHPNWPENIFGKVYFMRAEFLVLPILAFVSLLFINVKRKMLSEKQTLKTKNIQNHFPSEPFNHRIIVFFALLSLISAFLAKGTQEPFGQLFLWLVDNVPGFSIYRDSTKFYGLIALAYSVLIPFSLWMISERLSQIRKFSIFNFQFSIKSKFLNTKKSQYIVLLLFIFFWMFSLRSLLTTNSLKVHQVPDSYVQLKDFIVSQDKFFRTLWIPSWQRYGYFSDINPAIGRDELFKDASASGMIKQIKDKKMIPLLQQLSVKYIIIPEDSEGKLFVNDRKYDKKVYQLVVLAAKSIPEITQIKTFGKIVVLEIPNPRDRFWSNSSALKINYNFISPTLYKVSVSDAVAGDILVFSEGFDRNWIAENSEFRVQSSEFRLKVDQSLTENSFVLPKDGSYSFTVFYQPQRMVQVGLVLSGVTFLGIIVFLKRRKLN